MGFYSLKHDVEYDIDDPRRTLQHREIILRKKFLKQLYEEWYGVFVHASSSLPGGLFVELGSGGGFLKELLPGAITSDVFDLPGLDKIFHAEKMPFENTSVSGIFMIDVFHHIPDSATFLNEASRVLKRGGKIIMIEPANSWWGRFIYRNFHHEPFHPDAGWQIPSAGPMSGANGALPWIVFERDRQKFLKEYSGFRINYIKYHTPLRYLLSGGVSKKQLVPDSFFGSITAFEKFTCALVPGFSMFVTYEIERI